MDLTLNATIREKNSKAKSLRKSGYVPACIYGKGQSPLNIQIPQLELQKCLSSHAHKLNINVEGSGSFTVGIEEVQKDHLGKALHHISFKSMNSKEKTTLTIEINLEGKAKGQASGGMLTQTLSEVKVKGYPQDLPDSITLDVSSLDIGQHLSIKDIASNYKFEFMQADLDKNIVTCGHAKVIELPTASDKKEELLGTTEEAPAESTDEKIAA